MVCIALSISKTIACIPLLEVTRVSGAVKKNIKTVYVCQACGYQVPQMDGEMSGFAVSGKPWLKSACNPLPEDALPRWFPETSRC